MTTFTNHLSHSRVVHMYSHGYLIFVKPAHNRLRCTISLCLFCALFCLLPVLAGAQSAEIPSAAGHTKVGSDIHLDWSLGYGSVFSCHSRQPTSVANREISWSVQPNPTYQSIQINIPDFLRGQSIQVYLSDALSRRVWQGDIKTSDATEEIDLTQLPAGTYLLHLGNGSSTPVPPLRVVKLSHAQNP